MGSGPLVVGSARRVAVGGLWGVGVICFFAWVFDVDCSRFVRFVQVLDCC